MMTTAQLQEAVATAGVPWELWNLFEDARIEDNLRMVDAEDFGWRRFWDCTDTDEPSKMFWNHINNEAVCTARTAKWNGPAKTTHPDTSKVWDTRELVADFWQRACHAPDALGIVKLAQEWMRVFGSTVSVGIPTRSGNAAGGAPTPSGARGVGSAPSPASDASPITRTEYGTPYECKERERTERHKNRAPLSYYSTSMDFHQTKPISEGLPRYRDEETGEKERSLTQYVANTFRRLVSIRDGQRQRVSTSGSRLHVRNAMTCEPTSFRSTLQRGGKRKLVLVMDMSGSMDYEFHQHGAAFLAGIQTLRRQGVIDATILLSGGGKWCEVPRDFEPSHVAYLRASHGDESIKRCLNDHKAAVCAADTVLVYTDGNLTDGKVDAGQWRSVGVDLVGAVADQTDRVRREMEHHFSRVITAENGHQLATQVLDYITRHA